MAAGPERWTRAVCSSSWPLPRPATAAAQLSAQVKRPRPCAAKADEARDAAQPGLARIAQPQREPKPPRPSSWRPRAQPSAPPSCCSWNSWPRSWQARSEELRARTQHATAHISASAVCSAPTPRLRHGTQTAHAGRTAGAPQIRAQALCIRRYKKWAVPTGQPIFYRNFQNSAYRSGIFAICSLRMLLVH